MGAKAVVLKFFMMVIVGQVSLLAEWRQANFIASLRLFILFSSVKIVLFVYASILLFQSAPSCFHPMIQSVKGLKWTELNKLLSCEIYEENINMFTIMGRCRQWCDEIISMIIKIIYDFFIWNNLGIGPDVILCSWLGLKHQLTNQLTSAWNKSNNIHNGQINQIRPLPTPLPSTNPCHHRLLTLPALKPQALGSTTSSFRCYHKYYSPKSEKQLNHPFALLPLSTGSKLWRPVPGLSRRGF